MLEDLTGDDELARPGILLGDRRPRLGAYGLQLPDLAESGRLGPAMAQWPAWTIHTVVDTTLDLDSLREVLVVGDDQATAVHDRAGIAKVDRLSASTELRLVSVPTPEALIHPLLASTAVIASYWAGLPTFHAGAFVLDGAVWAVLGSRGDGKSSSLGWLAQAGYQVLTDDVLVLDGDNALAGPRCLDLREGAAEHFGMGEDLGVVGTRERWRVALSPVEPSVPFRGWVTLAWSEEIAVRPVRPSLRLPVLLKAKGLTNIAGDELRTLDLSARPFFEFSRPRSWTQLDAAMTSLLGCLSP